MDDRQTYKATMVAIEGKILNTSISIVIDVGAYRNYVLPKIIETCKLDKVKHEKLCLVQLAMGTKQDVSKIVRDCELN